MCRCSPSVVTPPIFEQATYYTRPNRLKTIRMTAITSRAWTTLPVRGKLDDILGPKYPSNHRTSKIMIIQVSMKFLLLGICSITHLTTSTFQAHPSDGEYLPPPLGGYMFINRKYRIGIGLENAPQLLLQSDGLLICPHLLY